MWSRASVHTRSNVDAASNARDSVAASRVVASASHNQTRPSPSLSPRGRDGIDFFMRADGTIGPALESRGSDPGQLRRLPREVAACDADAMPPLRVPHESSASPGAEREWGSYRRSEASGPMAADRDR